MQLTVLVDNNTLIDRYYLGEPGVAYYLEDGDVRILFDVGYSDIFLRNAQALGIDLPCTTTPRRLPSGGSFGPVTGCSAAPPRPKTGAGNRKLFLAFFSLLPLCLLTFVLCSTTITGVAL